MNQALQDQEEDAKDPLPHSEDDGAERGCAGAKPSDDAPAGYLQNRAAQRERGAGLARPDARPGKCQEGYGNSGSLDQRPLATRDYRYDPSVEPRRGGDVLANHPRPHVRKPEDIDANALPVKVRASAPASDVAPTTDATRNEPYTAAP
jgi:hypothetical protein